MAAPLIAPLVALAAALYPREAEAAKFSWMKPERIKQLRDWRAYPTQGDKTKGALTMIRPSEFLGATTTDPQHMARLIGEAGKFDPFRQQKHNQLSYLEVNPKKAPKARNHESRHRTGALWKATGRDDPLPYELMDNEGHQMEEWAALSGKRLQGQEFRPGAKGSSFKLGEVTPLAYDVPEEELLKYVTEVDVPLKNVGINLKPEGPGFTPEDKEAYLYNYIPYGKIPPPTPRIRHPIDVFPREEYDRLWDEWAALGRDRPSWIDWVQQFYPNEAK